MLRGPRASVAYAVSMYFADTMLTVAPRGARRHAPGRPRPAGVRALSGCRGLAAPTGLKSRMEAARAGQSWGSTRATATGAMARRPRRDAEWRHGRDTGVAAADHPTAGQPAHVHRGGRCGGRRLRALRRRGRAATRVALAADPRRHAAAGRRAEVPDAAADPAGDAEGRHDQRARAARPIDVYEISMRQFAQQVLPAGLPATMVWGYGPVAAERSNEPLIHNAPSLTIEAKWNRPVRVKWINELVDAQREPPPAPAAGRPDAALGEPAGRRPTGATCGRCSTSRPAAYDGPGPARDARARRGRGRRRERRLRRGVVPARGGRHPARLRDRGHLVRLLRGEGGRRARRRVGAGLRDVPVPQRPARIDALVPRPHPRDDPRSTSTPARPGSSSCAAAPRARRRCSTARSGTTAVLPGPAPKQNDKFPSNKTYYEIPIAVQDRSFNDDGSLFYPDSREFFDEHRRPTTSPTASSPRSGTRSSSATC